MMKQRDEVRGRIHKASHGEKALLSTKYKKLRNLVNCRIRKETILHNEQRVNKANSEGEVWKVVNEVIKPKKENEWSIKKDDNTITSNHEEISNIFNTFFVKKVEDLKSNIDKDFVSDPLEILNAEPKKDLFFDLKPISQKHLRKLMKKMKKKQSAGIDGLSQDKLVLGSKVLINPLLQIVNQSIREGMFPSKWKEAEHKGSLARSID